MGVYIRKSTAEHNQDKSKKSNFGIFDKMDVLQHNLAGAQSCYVQSTSQFDREPLEKSGMPTCLEHTHDMSGNYHGCSDISGLCSNDVCSESKRQSDRFRAQT